MFIVHFKRLGSRIFHDSFNQYVFFFSKQCTYCKTNAIYTWENFIRFFEQRFRNLFMYIEMSVVLYNVKKPVAQPSVVVTYIRPTGYQYWMERQSSMQFVQYN